MRRIGLVVGVACAALFIAVGAWTLRATAQVGSPDEHGGVDASVPDPAPGFQPKDWFALNPAGPDEIAFEDLLPIDRDHVGRAQEWAELEHGDAVHQAYRRVSAWGIDHAAQKRAEREAALAGIDELGVK